jgi:hypothetical protein
VRRAHPVFALGGPRFTRAAAHEQSLGEVLSLMKLAELAAEGAVLVLERTQALAVRLSGWRGGATLEPPRQGQPQSAKDEAAGNDDHDLGDLIDVHG